MSEKRFTWYDLRRFCNELTGGQLGKDVVVWGDEKGFKIKGVQTLEDDFINPSGEGVEPISAYKDEPDILLDENIVYEKGDPILITD